MILKSLNIISFGGLRNRELVFSDGVNVIFGENEAGKSSAAMFIKFIFYGLSSKPSKTAGASERQRYINRETSQAAGALTAESSDGTLWRIERLLIASDNAPARERVRIINQSTGETITGQNPGEYFFGVPEDVFVGTCFVSQSAEIRPGISGLGKNGSAVENLLTSADENLDIKHALEKIDNVRRGICHKNGSGGEITALREKRSALLDEMNSSAEKSAEIISLSTSLDDIKKRISELEETSVRNEGILASLEKITLRRRIDSSAQTKEKLEKLTKSLADLDASPFGAGFEETLLESERDIRAYDEECAAFDEIMPALPDSDDTEIPEYAEIIDEIHRTDYAAKMQLSAAAALLIAGLLGLAASFLLYFFNTGMYGLPLIMTLVLVVMGVVFIIKHAKTRGELLALLEEWDAESVAEIETAVGEKMNVLERQSSSALTKERMAQSLDASKLRFDAASDRLRTLADESGIGADGDIYDILSSLHEISDGVRAKRDQISAKIENLRGRLSALDEQLDGVDLPSADLASYADIDSEYGKIAASLDQEGIKNLLKEKEFTDSALKSARKRKETLEEKLLEAGKLTRSPDEYATMIASLDERIEELSLRHDACELAADALAKAGASMRSGVIPKIASRASEIISAATPHSSLTLDPSLNCTLIDENGFVSPEIFSRGTADLTYLALRTAVADEVFRSESPVVIFDESFAHIDMGRIGKVLSFLNSGEINAQYIIFTCRRDEAECAADLGIGVNEL